MKRKLLPVAGFNDTGFEIALLEGGAVALGIYLYLSHRLEELVELDFEREMRVLPRKLQVSPEEVRACIAGPLSELLTLSEGILTSRAKDDDEDLKAERRGEGTERKRRQREREREERERIAREAAATSSPQQLTPESVTPVTRDIPSVTNGHGLSHSVGKERKGEERLGKDPDPEGSAEGNQNAAPSEPSRAVTPENRDAANVTPVTRDTCDDPEVTRALAVTTGAEPDLGPKEPIAIPDDPNPEPEVLPREVPPEALAEAERQLEKPAGQPWTRTTAHISLGRRPLKKYPKIFMTPHELVRVIEKLQSSSLPRDRYRHVFEACVTKLDDIRATGKPPEFAHAVGWLTGYLLTNELKAYEQDLRLERAKSFTKNGAAAGAR